MVIDIRQLFCIYISSGHREYSGHSNFSFFTLADAMYKSEKDVTIKL